MKRRALGGCQGKGRAAERAYGEFPTGAWIPLEKRTDPTMRSRSSQPKLAAQLSPTDAVKSEGMFRRRGRRGAP
jgi:hypothetical protein